MKAFDFATNIIKALGLDPLLPAYSAITFALGEKTHGALVAYGNSTGQLVVPNGITGTLKLSGDLQPQRQVLNGAGAISIKSGVVLITASSAASVTLTAPTPGTDDGKKLTIVSTTPQAHTVTNSTPGFNNGSTASDVATFTASNGIGNSFECLAYNGIWYVIGTPKGVTLG